ncbi:MAG: carbonic anhydrase [Nannocystaceae bacterium]
MKESDKLLLSNKAWANERKMVDPDFFRRLESQQRPHFLWIGCSDSRVPANEITGTVPGEVFVHRNIANLVVPTDLNLLSVLQYAVEELKVTHVIVCGHYGCGGIDAAMSTRSFGPLNKWLRSIKDVHRLHRKEVDGAPPAKRAARLTELNVREQVANLTKTSLIQRAWRDRGGPWLHGWVYSLGDGILHELVAVAPGTPVDPIYTFDFDD